MNYHPNDDLTFQRIVEGVMAQTFGPDIFKDKPERNQRFLEAAIRLFRSCGGNATEAWRMVDYVYAQPSDAKIEEVGGVMVNLAALCESQDVQSTGLGILYLERIRGNMPRARGIERRKPRISPSPEQTLGKMTDPLTLYQLTDKTGKDPAE